jgi:hypothetical protein
MLDAELVCTCGVVVLALFLFAMEQTAAAPAPAASVKFGERMIAHSDVTVFGRYINCLHFFNYRLKLERTASRILFRTMIRCEEKQ